MIRHHLFRDYSRNPYALNAVRIILNAYVSFNFCSNIPLHRKLRMTLKCRRHGFVVPGMTVGSARNRHSALHESRSDDVVMHNVTPPGFVWFLVAYPCTLSLRPVMQGYRQPRRSATSWAGCSLASLGHAGLPTTSSLCDFVVRVLPADAIYRVNLYRKFSTCAISRAATPRNDICVPKAG